MNISKFKTLFSQSFVIVPLLLLLICISYANTLYSPFVLDDMHSFIEEPNVYVHNFSYESLTKLSNTVFGKARFIPLATFSLNHIMAKGHMPIYHITNIVIHLLVTLALLGFITTVLNTPVGISALKGIPRKYFAFFAAALWALNPVQTNAVTYIVQRMTSISALFYIVSLTFYLKARLATNRKHMGLFYVFCVFMALCAFFSKENSYMLPAAILLVEWMFVTPDIFKQIRRRMKWYHWLGILLLAAAIMPLMEHRWTSILNTENIRPFTWWERLLTQGRVVVYYISLLMLPLPGRMNFDYDFPVSHSIFSPPGTIVSILLLGLIIFWSFRRRNRYPLIAFGIFWYVLNLLIESTVIPLELVFEHRLYLPSVGFYIACLSILDLVVAKIKAKFLPREVDQVFILIMVVVVSLLSVGTSVRNNVWRDSYALYLDCVKKSPSKPRPHLNLGVAMGRDVRLEHEAIKEFEKVIELGKPKKENYLAATNNIVVAYSELGEFDAAISKGEKFLEGAPDYVRGEGYPRVMFSLANAYRQTGQYNEAIQALVSGILMEQKRLNSYFINSILLVFSEAYDSEEFRNKLELTEENGNKNISVWLRTARLLADLRFYDKSSFFIKTVLKKFPDHKLANELNETIQNQLQKDEKQEELININNHLPYNTSRIYKISLNLSDFIQKHYSPLNFAVGWLFDAAAKASQPDDPFVLLYRIKWLMKTGNTEKFVQEIEKASKMQPDFVPILRIAGDYYELKGNQGKAVEIFGHILEMYPGEPLWRKYERRIIEYSKNITMQ